ncbi:hypothetical protein IV596_000366 [Salmonella enterica]|nr:hypothetical protein [Salmonella enterica]
MSLEKAKNLEDLKARVQKIIAERNAVVEQQRPLAIKSALKEIAEYFLSQDFTVTYSPTRARSFTAKYNEIEVIVTSTDDNESFFGADYEICLEYGQKKLAARLLVNRGTDIRGPNSGDIDSQIDDYKNRYLPEIEALSLNELDGTYKLYSFVKANSGHRVENYTDGKQLVEKLFEGI